MSTVSSDTVDNQHVWNFFRAGGATQVSFNKGADIEALAQLDQKLWTALSCPATDLRFDQRTLNFLDADKDGRIRVPEILAAIEWLKQRLGSLDSLFQPEESIDLSELNQETDEGRALRTTIVNILTNLGKAKETRLSLKDATDTAKILADSKFNGDGVVYAECSDDAEVQQTIADIIAVSDSVKDLSGKDGIDQAKSDAFFDAVKARVEWQAKGDASVLPLGDQTAAAAAAIDAVRTKIDDFFTRCDLAAFDTRFETLLSGKDEDVAKLAEGQLSTSQGALEGLPLAKITGGQALPLTAKINPYWQQALASFRTVAAQPLLGKDVTELTKADWDAIQAKVAPYKAWIESEAGKTVASLDAARLATLAKGETQAKINELIQKDLSLAPQYALYLEVEKIICFRANLLQLLNNYVNMGYLYDPAKYPIYRVGKLYLDGRAVLLCFEVKDLGAFSALAAASKCCLVYCDLKRPGEGKSRTICGVVTAGNSQSLWVGRNGLFYDMDGTDWEATITKIDEHETSLKEAFWAPWRKIAKMISEQINKLLASKQDAVIASAGSKIESSVTAPAAAAKDAAAAAPKKMDGAALASSVAAIGIAVGLLGSAIGGLVSTIAGIPVWKSCLGVLVVILAVSLPSVLITWFKLRARDLSPILNAGGWAINRELHFSLGKLWTAQAALPSKAKVSLTDPFEDKHPVRNAIIALLIIGAILAGFCCWCKKNGCPFGKCKKGATTSEVQTADKAAADKPATDAAKPAAPAPEAAATK